MTEVEKATLARQQCAEVAAPAVALWHSTAPAPYSRASAAAKRAESRPSTSRATMSS